MVYVPETCRSADVWEKLNTRRKYLAVVFDEFGGTAGLITFEDLIEEIFGELQDEFDDEMALIARDKEGRIYLRGDLLVSDVNEYLELELATRRPIRLAALSLVCWAASPAIGEEVKSGDTVIRVEAMEDLGVSEVSLQLPPSITSRPSLNGRWPIMSKLFLLSLMIPGMSFLFLSSMLLKEHCPALRYYLVPVIIIFILVLLNGLVCGVRICHYRRPANSDGANGKRWQSEGPKSI